MASCNQCRSEVGCSCNLISGVCLMCYNRSLDVNAVNYQPLIKKSTKRVRYINESVNPPNTEFEVILKTPSISKEEKIRRINDILEKARLDLQNQTK